jgi:hypothetical protein
MRARAKYNTRARPEVVRLRRHDVGGLPHLCSARSCVASLPWFPRSAVPSGDDLRSGAPYAARSWMRAGSRVRPNVSARIEQLRKPGDQLHVAAQSRTVPHRKACERHALIMAAANVRLHALQAPRADRARRPLRVHDRRGERRDEVRQSEPGRGRPHRVLGLDQTVSVAAFDTQPLGSEPVLRSSARNAAGTTVRHDLPVHVDW